MTTNDPQQLRRALDEIRKALDQYPREALAEILATVFKEYVVDNTQPMASGAQILDARSDLEGMSFAEIVVWLQTHVDAPELALFEVSGNEVSVRADGRTVRLRAPAPVAAPPPPAPVAMPAPPRAQASTSLPAQPAAPVAAPVPAAPAAPPAGAVQPTTEEKPTAETGTRFSLLEVD